MEFPRARILHVASVTVRVVPGAGRRAVQLRGGEVVVRVQAPPAEGRATEEARRTLADHLGIPAGDVRLLRGARSRIKVFEIAGLTASDLSERLSGA